MKEFSHPDIKEKVPLDLNRAITSTITVARNEWKYVAEMETELDPSLPPVLCLPGEFNQVILNLLVNAAHAIADVVRKGGPAMGKIKVQTLNCPGWAEIRIQDTGTGIPEKVQNRIYDPFFTTKEIGKGTGQGLAIARSVIINKHGGSIHFETEAGKGTTFIIRLPHNGKAIPTMKVAV
jgi:signal transduction histidine kinase